MLLFPLLVGSTAFLLVAQSWLLHNCEDYNYYNNLHILNSENCNFVFLSQSSHHRPGNTIETNLKNLNVSQFDLAFEVT